MAVKRGMGRQALIEATAEVLRAGGEVQVSDIAAELGVSHTLVYRHFPEGGREELIAEAYAHLFRGLARNDIDEFFELITRQGHDRDALVAFAQQVMSPRRRDLRAARLLALAQSLASDLVASRVDSVRQELVGTMADRLRMFDSRWSEAEATALAVYLLAFPLGVTAVAGRDLSKTQRDYLAGFWADSMLAILGPGG